MMRDSARTTKMGRSRRRQGTAATVSGKLFAVPMVALLGLTFEAAGLPLVVSEAASDDSFLPRKCVRGSTPGPLGSAGQHPKVYIYGLPARYVNGGYRRTCVLDKNCVFNGPPITVRGVETWKNGQFDWPMMLYHKLLHSPHCTDDVGEADLFFVPAFRTHPHVGCGDTDELWKLLRKENPALSDGRAERAASIAKRHILLEARVSEQCKYFNHDRGGGLMKHWNLEVPNGIPFAYKKYFQYVSTAKHETRLKVRESRPYSFPYPTQYHGPAAQTPAVLKPRGRGKYLWMYMGSSQGREIRKFVELECRHSARCYYKYPTDIRSHLNQTTGVDTQTVAGDEHLVNAILNATFCAEPPGSTVSRKGLVDAIVLGCIPIVFEPQQLVLYEAFVTRAEFESFAVFIPERLLVGNATKRYNRKVETGTKGPVDYTESFWTLANLDEHAEFSKFIIKGAKEGSEYEHNKRLAWEAMGEEGGPPWAGFDWPERALRLEPFLLQIPLSEIIAKQMALAKIAPRFVIQAESGNGEVDAVEIMLERSLRDATMSGDEIAAAATKRMKPSGATAWHPASLMQSLADEPSAYWSCTGTPTPPSTYCT